MGALALSLVKSSPKKIGALISSIKFLSPKLPLHLYKSTIRPCMSVVMSGLVLLAATWKY